MAAFYSGGYFSMEYAVRSLERRDLFCCRCHPERVKQRKGRDDTRRRRSANADILESCGLPTTGSFNDMKSLQGSTLHDVSRDADSYCGLGGVVKSIVKATKAKKTAARARMAATRNRQAALEYNLIPNGTESFALGNNVEMGMPLRPSFQEPAGPESGPGTGPETETDLDWLAGAAPQTDCNVMMPGQWLRRRSGYSDLVHGLKG